MAEWKLFPDGTIPEFTQKGFFATHPHVPPEHQLGHSQRIKMVADVVNSEERCCVSDLGCGDGSLLRLIECPDKWGYDAGVANIRAAHESGLFTVWEADITDDEGEWELGCTIVLSEVVEHMADPHGYLQYLHGHSVPDYTTLILSSPSVETNEWHYEHHAWAWDLAGYNDLVTNAGWKVTYQDDCEAEFNYHGGVIREQRFQVLVATA